MNSKTLIWIGMFVGSTIGGYIPSLWGNGLLTYASAISTAMGGIIGIWIAFKLSNN